MRSSVKKPRRPTAHQSSWLRRIAVSPLMVTKTEGILDSYSLQNGDPVPTYTAKTLIDNGWVIGERDGMFDIPQTYTVLKPS